MNPPTTNATAPSRKTGRLKRWLVRVGILAVILLALVPVVALMGRVEGEEFSPQTFRRRVFVYFEIPLVHLQVLPIRRRDKTGDLEKYLAQQKYLALGQTGDNQDQWHLVRCTRGGSLLSSGDAGIFCAYLDTINDQGQLRWLDWSKKHRTLAKILWPRVAELAQQRLYIFIPDLMELAAGAVDANRLHNDIRRSLAAKYLELSLTEQALEDHQTAVELLTAGLKLDPDNVELLKARAESYKMLGETDKADADRKRTPGEAGSDS